MSINPFVDDRDNESPVFKYYRGTIMDINDSEEEFDKYIETTMNEYYKDANENIKYLVHTVIIPNIKSMKDMFLFKVVRTVMDDGESIRPETAYKWIEDFSQEHQFGKYGPIFMVKYIEPVFDTRDNKVFAISFRDLAYNEDMWKLIPDEWKVKDGNTFKLFVRDKMEDGFRNLYERLLFLEYIVEGELLNENE